MITMYDENNKFYLDSDQTILQNVFMKISRFLGVIDGKLMFFFGLV